MEKSKEKSASAEFKPRMGRPPQAEKKGIEMPIEGDYVVINIPGKDLRKRFLSDILN